MIDDISKVIKFIRKHGAWVIVGKVFVSLMSLILSIFLAKMMSKQEYGSYQYYLSVFFLLSSFSIPGATNAIIKYVAMGYEFTFKQLLKLRFRYSLLASFIFAILTVYNFFLSNATIAFVYLMFSLLFPFFHSFDLFAYYLHAKLQLKRLNKIYVIRSLFQVFITTLAYYLTQSVELALIAFIASFALINIVVHYKLLPNVTIEDFDANIAFQAKSMALSLSLIGILKTIVSQIDKVLIFNLINPESLAIYGVGLMIGMTINSLFKAILSSFSAKLVLYDLKKWHFASVFLFGSIVGIFTSLLIQDIIELLYGDVYKKSSYYASIILCSLGVYLVNTLYHESNMFHQKKNVNSIYISEIGVSCTQLIVIFYLFWLVSSENILYFLPFLYPLKFVLSILLIYLTNLIRKTIEN
jgi:O-antigen/teichoic acid export membrane protein